MSEKSIETVFKLLKEASKELDDDIETFASKLKMYDEINDDLANYLKDGGQTVRESSDDSELKLSREILIDKFKK